MKNLVFGILIWVGTILTGSVMVSAIQSEFSFGQAIELSLYMSGMYGFLPLIVFIIFYQLFIDKPDISQRKKEWICILLAPALVLTGFVIMSGGDLLGCFAEMLFVQAFISYCSAGMLNIWIWNRLYFKPVHEKFDDKVIP